MYNIIKDLSDTCGVTTPYATKSGWYIIEDLHDGRVKISNYNASANTWSDNTTVDYNILIIEGEVVNTKEFVKKYEPQVLKEWENKLYERLERAYGDNLKSFDAIQAIDFFIDQWDYDIFADTLKKYKVAYKYREGDAPKDMLDNDTQLEYYKTLKDWWR